MQKINMNIRKILNAAIIFAWPYYYLSRQFTTVAIFVIIIIN
jgi:hypothetical protein